MLESKDKNILMYSFVFDRLNLFSIDETFNSGLEDNDYTTRLVSVTVIVFCLRKNNFSTWKSYGLTSFIRCVRERGDIFGIIRY